MNKPKSLERLEESLAKLPSVGKRSAERMAYALLDMPDEDIEEFSSALINMKNSIKFCPVCGALMEGDKCEICDDETRDQSTLLVVSYPKDLITFENLNSYHGLYHVLGGVISVSKGSNVSDLSIASLVERVKEKQFEEIIIATNPTVEGETTAIYVSKLLEQYCPKITKLAYGLQMGGNLDYTDSLTLSKAIEGRHKI